MILAAVQQRIEGGNRDGCVELCDYPRGGGSYPSQRDGSTSQAGFFKRGHLPSSTCSTQCSSMGGRDVCNEGSYRYGTVSWISEFVGCQVL